MVKEHQSPDTFFILLKTVKKLEENLKAINEEIYDKYGPEPEYDMEYKLSILPHTKTVVLAQLLYWKEELYAQINLN
jgi:hypothetical protein